MNWNGRKSGFGVNGKSAAGRMKSKKVIVSGGGELEEMTNEYPYGINFYAIPPFGKIDLEDADDLVIERLNILRVFDEIQKEGALLKKDYQQYIEHMNNMLHTVPSKHGDNFYKKGSSGGSAKNPQIIAARRRDHVSHFLLRLYYCRTEELRKWFIKHESDLLRFRLMDEKNQEEIPSFLYENNLNYETVAVNERGHLFAGLVNWNNTRRSVSGQTLYRLPFEEALELVRGRKVYLQDGYAYVLSSEMVSIICSRFRLELANSLASLFRSLPGLEEEDRLIPRLHSLHIEHVAKKERAMKGDMNSNRDPVTPDMINDLAKTSFPPCMRSLHENLRKDHHLKHYGRLHYGLFLKGIGLNMEDALTFFRDEFVQKVTPEKFQKEYSYNIRYNYGKEGKKLSLSGYSCAKIQNENGPGPGDAHGCPFKHYDNSNLKALLRRYGADDEAVGQMLQLVENKAYSQACTCYFSSRHNDATLRDDKGVYHPNQFYVESRRNLKGLSHMPSQEKSQPALDETVDETFDENDEYDTVLSGLNDYSLIESEVGAGGGDGDGSQHENPSTLNENSGSGKKAVDGDIEGIEKVGEIDYLIGQSEDAAKTETQAETAEVKALDDKEKDKEEEKMEEGEEEGPETVLQ